jgi:hypothetical protein
VDSKINELLGEADVWHEGSRSFYRARLMHKLTPQQVDSTARTPVPPQDDSIHKRAQLEQEWSELQHMKRQCKEFIEKQKTPPPRLTWQEIDKIDVDPRNETMKQTYRAIESAVRAQFGVNDE